MIDHNILREHPEVIQKTVADRGWRVDLKAIRRADESYRQLLQSVEQQRATINAYSKERQNTDQRAKLHADKSKLKTDEKTLRKLKGELDASLGELPNILKEDVPAGHDASGNIVVRTVGEPPRFTFPFKDYLALAAKHDLIDLERAAKVSGARFCYLKNEVALLNLALVRYGFDIALREGFTPVLPPVLIGEEAMAGMGGLSHGGGEGTF